MIEFFIKEFQKIIDTTCSLSRYARPRPYRNAFVRFRKCSIQDFDLRRKVLEDVGLNAFMFPASLIPGCDLLSDSGTTTMTMEQLSQILLGDEAYGSNEGYFELKDQIEKTFGPEWKGLDKTQDNLFIFHQGRAAEHALFTLLREEMESTGVKPIDVVIPSNSHFDTTEANIENNRMVPINLPCQEHLDHDESFPFRGNIDIESLSKLLKAKGDKVPIIYLTITNNTAGGQPVSMANIKKVHELATAYKVPFFIDASRFAENAWFIKQKEDGYKYKTIEQVVYEMFSYCDGFHASFKKDGMVNIGGGIVLKQHGLFLKKYPHFPGKLNDHQILTEGHPTYGGLAGRDLKGLVQGLKTVVKEQYLKYRIEQVERFGRKLVEYNIPIIKPIGGHAVYIDMDKFFNNEAKDEDFKGVALMR